MNIGYLYAIATGFFCGINPIIIQGIISQESIPTPTALLIRAFAMPFVMLPIALPRLKKTSIPKQLTAKIPLLSVFWAVTLILLYTSYLYIPTGVGVALHYTYPLVILVSSVVFYGFTCTRQSICALLLSLAGIVLLSVDSLSSGRMLLGILLAFGSAVVYSWYFLTVEHNGFREIDSTVLVFLVAIGDIVAMLLYAMVTNQLVLAMSAKAFCMLLLSGVINACASLCLMQAIKRVGSVHTSILGTLEPIVCTFAGVIFLHEKVTVRMLLGGCLVLAAVIIVTLQKSKRSPKNNAKAEGTVQ